MNGHEVHALILETATNSQAAEGFPRNHICHTMNKFLESNFNKYLCLDHINLRSHTPHTKILHLGSLALKQSDMNVDYIVILTHLQLK